jgi:hypothetical protein
LAVAGRLREEKKEAVEGQRTGAEPAVKEKPQNLRQAVMAAKKEEERKSKLAEKAEEMITAPIRMGTSRLLSWTWTTLIPSFGFDCNDC